MGELTVLRLNVSVSDSFSVHILESAEDLRKDEDCLDVGEYLMDQDNCFLFGVTTLINDLVEQLSATNLLHDDVIVFFIFKNVHELYDVLVFQHLHDRRFSLEGFHLFIGCKRKHNLESESIPSSKFP